MSNKKVAFVCITILYFLFVPFIHLIFFDTTIAELTDRYRNPAAPLHIGDIIFFYIPLIIFIYLSILLGVIFVPLALFGSDYQFVFGIFGWSAIAPVASLYYVGYLPIAIWGAFSVENEQGIPFIYQIIGFLTPHPGRAIIHKATRGEATDRFDGEAFDRASANAPRGKYAKRLEQEEFRKMSDDLAKATGELNEKQAEKDREEAAWLAAKREVAEHARKLNEAQGRADAYEKRIRSREQG